jgi:hypothetical protein
MDILLAQRQVHANRGLFVAECDIKGFFDCVAHHVAERALDELIADAKRKNPNFNVHPRALEIFEAYLACYSFLRNVRQGAELELKRRRPEATYPWYEDELRHLHGADATLERIGVPQGGALTPRTQKITSNLSGGCGSGGNRVRIDGCRKRLYVYDRCRARTMPRRPSASIARGSCFGKSINFPVRSSDWQRTVPFRRVKPTATSSTLSN